MAAGKQEPHATNQGPVSARGAHAGGPAGAREAAEGAAQRDHGECVRQLAKTARKWWPLFLTAAGWDANDKSCFLFADGSPRDGIFQQLVIWLYEQDVTKGVFKPMLAWAQAKLNAQLSARLLPIKKEYVCTLPGVKERKDEIYTNARQQHMEHMTDLQADVEGSRQTSAGQGWTGWCGGASLWRCRSRAEVQPADAVRAAGDASAGCAPR